MAGAKRRRGGQYGSATTRGQSSYDNAVNGLYTEGDAGSHKAEAAEIVQGVRDVLTDFGYPDALKAVYIVPKGLRGETDFQAGMNGQGDLRINTKYLQDGNPAEDTYHTTNTFRGTGAHEAGHAVVYELIKDKVLPNAGGLAQSNARKNLSLEKAILREAQSRYGSNPRISGYGSTSYGEKIAEAVADVYSNKTPNPYSKVIVDVMKDIRSGAFKPKIK